MGRVCLAAGNVHCSSATVDPAAGPAARLRGFVNDIGRAVPALWTALECAQDSLGIGRVYGLLGGIRDGLDLCCLGGWKVGSAYLPAADRQAGQDNGTDAPMLLYGYLSAVLLAVALL
jgi:hypothetical protein